MFRLFFIALFFSFNTFVSAQIGMRNGWLVNETPANMNLIDKDGEWVISVQGGYHADWATVTDFTANEKEFVQTNPPHGYSCVSMKVDVNPKTKMVIKVFSGKQLLLKTCLEDRSIPYPRR